jgi:hypothetical protein
MGRIAARLLTGLALVLTAGCGVDPDTPKRTVDPLDEALRFYPADAEAVILVRPDRTSFSTLGQVTEPLSPTLSPVPDVTAPLLELGEPQEIADLATIEEGPSPRVAVGADTARKLLGDQSLAVLVTEREAELAELLDRADRRGDLRPTGEFHEARLFQGSSAAFAERDGVLLIGYSEAAIRSAIEIRDGDSDEHLDDRAAEDALDELSATAPVLLFLNMRQITTEDPEGEELARRADWIGELHHAALAARPAPAGLALQLFGDADGTDLSETLSQSDLEVLPAPIEPAGRVTVDGDEVRAELLLPR